jgi:hypothetical protein
MPNISTSISINDLKDKEKEIQDLSKTVEEMRGQIQSKGEDLAKLTKIVDVIRKSAIFVKGEDLPKMKARAQTYERFKEDLKVLDEKSLYVSIFFYF